MGSSPTRVTEREQDLKLCGDLDAASEGISIGLQLDGDNGSDAGDNEAKPKLDHAARGNRQDDTGKEQLADQVLRRDTGCELHQPKRYERESYDLNGISAAYRKLQGRLRFGGLWPRGFESDPCHSSLVPPAVFGVAVQQERDTAAPERSIQLLVNSK